MKILSILLLLFISITAFAQSDSTKRVDLSQKVKFLDEQMYQAGCELRDFKKYYYTGVSLEIIGCSVGAVCIISNKPELAIVGGIATLVGGIMCVASHKHIGWAGMYLTGKGITIPISKNKQ